MTSNQDQSSAVFQTLFAKLNPHSPVPLFQQIENLVQCGVASQQLKAGDKLPRPKELAKRLDFNPAIIAKAYRELELMGYVYARRGMGVFIKKDIDARCREDCHRRLIRDLFGTAVEAQVAGLPAGTIQNVLKAARTTSVTPYGDVPEDILKLAK